MFTLLSLIIVIAINVLTIIVVVYLAFQPLPAGPTSPYPYGGGLLYVAAAGVRVLIIVATPIALIIFDIICLAVWSFKKSKRRRK